MSRKKDLTGRRFGKLTVAEPTKERKNGYVVWVCKCDCGNTVHVSSRFLKKGWTTTCGCEGKKLRYQDLTGRRFGKLVAISVLEERDVYGRIQWNCVCDCGNTVIAPAGQLTNGYRRSCGCLSRPPLKDWVGKQFGELTVLSYDGKRDKKHYWKCRCSCGNEASVFQSSLMSGHTTSCGCRNVPYATKHFVEGTCLENIRNRHISRNNSTGVRGVYKSNRSGKWVAQITFQGKTRYLGSFDTLEQASQARKKGEELFDEFLARYDREHPETRTESAARDEIQAETMRIVQTIKSEKAHKKIPV